MRSIKFLRRVLDLVNAMEERERWERREFADFGVYIVLPPTLAPKRLERLRWLDALLTLKGGAALSCCNGDVYEPLERAGWKRFDFAASSSVKLASDNVGEARKRTETLYISPV